LKVLTSFVTAFGLAEVFATALMFMI